MYKMDLYITYPNEKMLELMIIEEEKRRMSDEYRNSCTLVKDQPNGWLTVTENMQHDIVNSFGFVNEISHDISLNMMRRAHIIYPNNDIFTQVPLYVRNNKANKGTLNVDDNMPDFNVYDLDNKLVMLSDLVDNRKTIMFFGSHT